MSKRGFPFISASALSVVLICKKLIFIYCNYRVITSSSGTYSLLQCGQLLTLALTPQNSQQVLSNFAQLSLQSLHLHQQGVVLFLLHANTLERDKKKTLKNSLARCEQVAKYTDRKVLLPDRKWVCCRHGGLLSFLLQSLVFILLLLLLDFLPHTASGRMSHVAVEDKSRCNT